MNPQTIQLVTLLLKLLLRDDKPNIGQLLGGPCPTCGDGACKPTPTPLRGDAAPCWPNPPASGTAKLTSVDGVVGWQ